MTDTPNAKRQGLSTRAWVGVLLALYVLSIGPIAFLNGTGILGYNALAAAKVAYTPLGWIGMAIPPIGRLLAEYQGACTTLGRRLALP
jgi:hypothetical protein